MCGISGFYSKSLKNFDNVIVKMNLAIAHRGPDSNGVWQDEKSGIFLGHQRLSIIDLSNTGNQPMLSSSGRYILTYNGEIYNHLEIRKQLVENNPSIIWRGKSDTETLIEAIDHWGIKNTLNKIDGMFAFGLWDRKLRSLILARDRVGEKPLYYGWQGKGNNKVFIFGSELKALRVHPEFNGKINRDAITLQLRHNCIPAPYSIFTDIYKLLPGHFIVLKDNDLKKSLLPKLTNYWNIIKTAVEGNDNQFQLNYSDLQRELEKKLKLTIKKQMISDVPLGVFLSSGIDSSTVVALMQSQSNKPVKTFTVGFEEKYYDESKYAKKIAKYIGTDHTELNVSSKQALEVIPNMASIYDEPFSDSSQIPTYLVSQLSKNYVKVALTGDGGDELFCGYNRYLVNEKFLKISNTIPSFLKKILVFLINSISNQKLTKFINFMPGLGQHVNLEEKIYKIADILEAETLHEYYHLLCSHWKNPTDIVLNSKEPKTILSDILNSELKKLNNQQQMMVMDFITYLPNDILVKVDRASMSSSLETRAPLLDHNLVEHVWKIPHSFKFKNGHGKWILRQILSQYIPKNLIERPKMGFGVPIGNWLRGPLRDWAESLLSEKRLIQEGYFNPKIIRYKWSEHLSGKKNWQYDLWDILMFQAWIDK